MKKGLLIINLGTPSHPNKSAVRAFLRTFLLDKRVIALPTPLRYLLVYGAILPFRTSASVKAYQSIWQAEGSPLLYHSQQLAEQLSQKLGESHHVELAMRYGHPSIPDALKALENCEHITILPLFPQYASATTGSVIEAILNNLSSKAVIPGLNIIPHFYQHPGFIQAQAIQIKRHLPVNTHLLFSYHGLPEFHLKQAGCKKICQDHCPFPSDVHQNISCYRAQCLQTSALIASALHLNPDKYTTAFQSRLGKTEWIKPYTDETLKRLAATGIKNIAVTCPSFVSDCLETLEEIGIRAQEDWLKLGGDTLTLIPCLNAAPEWVNAIVSLTHT